MTRQPTPRIDPEQVAEAVANATRALTEFRATIGPAVQQALAAYTKLAKAMAAALPAEHAREDGQNAATGATETPGDPEPAETPTGRQTGAQDRDEWTRALEQVQHLQRARKSDGKEIARLEAELVQARAVVDRVTAAQLALRCADDRRTIRNALNPADDPQTCHSGVVCTPASRCADHADQEARP